MHSETPSLSTGTSALSQTACRLAHSTRGLLASKPAPIWGARPQLSRGARLLAHCRAPPIVAGAHKPLLALVQKRQGACRRPLAAAQPALRSVLTAVGRVREVALLSKGILGFR